MILFGIGGLLVAFGVFGSFKYWTLRLGLIGFGLGWIMPFQYGYATWEHVGFNIGFGLAAGISLAVIGLIIDLARRFRLENFRPNQVKHPEHNQQTQYTASAVEEEKAFDLAATEVDKGNIRNGLWTKLLVDNNGDENITRLHYIRLRAAEILKEIEKDRTKSDEQHWSDDSFDGPGEKHWSARLSKEENQSASNEISSTPVTLKQQKNPQVSRASIVLLYTGLVFMTLEALVKGAFSDPEIDGIDGLISVVSIIFIIAVVWSISRGSRLSLHFYTFIVIFMSAYYVPSAIQQISEYGIAGLLGPLITAIGLSLIYIQNIKFWINKKT